MSKYDGLIIPRSYSEYINKTDAATFSQASQLPNTMDSVPTANSNRAARSGGIFDANAIITADSKVLSGPAISARSIIRVFFTAAITGSDAATGLTLTYNGNTYAVKATANGALKDFTPYPITTETRELTKGKTEETEETKTKGEIKSGTRATVTNYVFCQAYTTLEMMFDGNQFIIIGNPVVISNSDYTVYTDGSITYTTFVVDRMRIAQDNQISNIDNFRGLTAGIYVSTASGGATQGVCPSGFGIVLNIEKEGYDINYTWRFQLAFSTNGQLFFRCNTNNAGWGEWKEL